MEVIREKNEYGWYKVHCPFCAYTTRESGGDKLRWLKQHIMKSARLEAFEHYCNSDGVVGKHLDYASSHTNNEKVVVTQNRVFDQDLKFKK